MEVLLYVALVLSQIGSSAKQYAMKKCGAIAKGESNSIRINLIRGAICLAVSILVWIFTDATASDFFGVLIAVLAGIGTSLNLFTWILSAQKISLTLLEGVCTVGVLVVPLVLAPYLYGGESVSLLQWIGSALVILSLFLFSQKEEKKSEKASFFGSMSLIFFCAFGVTLASVAKKVYTYHVVAKGMGSIGFFTMISFLTVFLVFAGLLPFYQRRERRFALAFGQEPQPLTLRRIWPYILIAAFSLYVCEIFATVASDLPAAIYYPATKALGILGCFVLDIAVFREKITCKKLLGLATLLTAVVLISV